MPVNTSHEGLRGIGARLSERAITNAASDELERLRAALTTIIENDDLSREEAVEIARAALLAPGAAVRLENTATPIGLRAIGEGGRKP